MTSQKSIHGTRDSPVKEMIPSQRSNIDNLISILDISNDTLQGVFSNERNILTQRTIPLSSMFHDAVYFSSVSATSFVAAGIASIVAAGEAIEDMVLGPQEEGSISKESESIYKSQSCVNPCEKSICSKFPCESDDEKTATIMNRNDHSAMSSSSIISEKSTVWRERKEIEKMKREAKVNAITKIHIRESRLKFKEERPSKLSCKKIGEIKSLPDINSLKIIKRRERELKVSAVTELHLKKTNDDIVTLIPSNSECVKKVRTLMSKGIIDFENEDRGVSCDSKKLEKCCLQYHETTSDVGISNNTNDEIPFDEVIHSTTGLHLSVETDSIDRQEFLQAKENAKFTPSMLPSRDGKMSISNGITSVKSLEASIDACYSQAENSHSPSISKYDLYCPFASHHNVASVVEDPPKKGEIIDLESSNAQEDVVMVGIQGSDASGIGIPRRESRTENDQRYESASQTKIRPDNSNDFLSILTAMANEKNLTKFEYNPNDSLEGLYEKRKKTVLKEHKQKTKKKKKEKKSKSSAKSELKVKTKDMCQVEALESHIHDLILKEFDSSPHIIQDMSPRETEKEEEKKRRKKKKKNKESKSAKKIKEFVQRKVNGLQIDSQFLESSLNGSITSQEKVSDVSTKENEKKNESKTKKKKKRAKSKDPHTEKRQNRSKSTCIVDIEAHEQKED
jgi:hypothetical protein